MSDLSLGVVGLGVMGRNLALNALDAGVTVAGFDLGEAATVGFQEEAGGRAAASTTDIAAFLGALPAPRALLVMVPAGKPVDAVLASFAPHLTPGDLLIDGGNSFFKDTQRRQAEMDALGLHFMGMGVSGGEEGARRGPSMMPGGPLDAYTRVAPVLERMAARVNGEPCVAHLGAGAAGHYVKMVHNGIEYALMQLIAEAYDLLKRGAGLGNLDLAAVFTRWNEGPLQSFLVEITADIFDHPDTTAVDPAAEGASTPHEALGAESPTTDAPGTGGVAGATAAAGLGDAASPAEVRYLLDAIADTAKQKGTGKWTSQDALDLGVPTPTIDAAVSARYLSALKSERVAAAALLGEPDRHVGAGRDALVDALEGALHAAFHVAYAQGFALLRAASDAYAFSLDLGEVARIWRGGCIIRAAMLETFRSAFAEQPEVPNLLVAPAVTAEVRRSQEHLREAVAQAARAGIPTPALSASLDYLDSYRSAWLPANLVQAQRDYFGAHTFERTDREGTFHAQWIPAGL
ncbi:MAG TPA: NADP-dependent decarboxylating phosphogluconate dehydrogenase [Rubricoccaceae bacterium]|jgi:6-phosphogluconate dehydrogenase